MPGFHLYRGVTLIELIVVLSVTALLVMLAAPSFSLMIQDSRSRTLASKLVAAVNLARTEAILRDTPVSLCPSSMVYSGAPVCSGDYSGGWIVYTNPDRNSEVRGVNEQVLAAFDALPAGYFVSNRAGTRLASGTITYLPDGSSRRNLTLLICSDSNPRPGPWSVVLNYVGRPRVARGEGACNGRP